MGKKKILGAAIAASVTFVLGIATGVIATPVKTTTTEKVVEVPVQVEVPVEVEVEKIVEIEIPVEIEKTVEIETIIEVEKPVEVERVIEVEKIVEIEKIIEIEVPVETKKVFTSNPGQIKPGYTYYVSSVLHQYPSIYGFVGFGQKNEFVVDFDSLVKNGLTPYSVEYGFEVTVTSVYSHTSKKDVWSCVVHAVYELETKDGQKVGAKQIL